MNKKEILRYLGYKNQEIDENLNSLIEQCIAEVEKIPYRVINKKFKLIKGENVVVNDYLVLKGNDIKKHLKYADQCIILLIALDYQLEKLINLNQKINLTKALILDACASTYIEEIADEITNKIKNETDRYITYRYSPGYGDLALDVQKKLVDLVQGHKIGVTVSDSFLLSPRKAISAIIGIQDVEDSRLFVGCDKSCDCKKIDCLYRRS